MESYRSSAYTQVPLLALALSPEKNFKKKIATTGVLSLEFEDVRLYFSREAFAHYRSEYAVPLEISDSQLEQIRELHGAYVTVDGLFVRYPAGPRLMGWLREIERLERALPTVPRR